MPAPNIATLYDFETHYENAVSNYYSGLNGNPFNQVLTPRTVSNVNAETDYLQTPRLMVRAAIVGIGLHETVADGNYYESHYMGTITLDVVTARNDTAQNHGNLRGRARQGMLSATAICNTNSVPYYQTVAILPLTSNQLIDADNDEIMTQLVYSLEFFIKPDQYANS